MQKICFSLFIVLFSTVALAAGHAGDPVHDFEDWLTQYMSDNSIPSLSVALVNSEGVVYQKSFWYARSRRTNTS